MVAGTLDRYPFAMPTETIVRYAPIQTPIGTLVAGATETELVLFEFERRSIFDHQLERIRAALHCTFEPGDSPVFEPLRKQLDQYFRKRLKEFDLPVRILGTDFQSRVWKELRRIPYGTTISYSTLASRIGKPNAVRAVGRANGDNRMSIIIPCHRVVGSDGSLVGYGGTLPRKKQLLELEGATANLKLFDD